MPTQIEMMTERAATVMKERHVAAPFAASVACTEFGGGDEGVFHIICQALGKHSARARVAETKRLHDSKSKVPAWLRDIHPASPDDAAASRACSGEKD